MPAAFLWGGLSTLEWCIIVPAVITAGLYLFISLGGALGLIASLKELSEPIEKLSRPKSSDARFYAAIRWAEKHRYELLGCLRTPKIRQETAAWESFTESSALIYLNVPNGSGDFVGHYAFESLFEGELALITTTNASDLTPPLPPGIYYQAFPQLRHHPGGDTEHDWSAEAENASSEGSAADIELEGLWREHCQAARFLLEQGAAFDSGVKWDLEYGWEDAGDGASMKESFEQAIAERDFPLLLHWNIRSQKVLNRFIYNYIRAIPLWPLRVGWWVLTRPQKLTNLTIEEQCARRFAVLPKDVRRRTTLLDAAKDIYGEDWEKG